MTAEENYNNKVTLEPTSDQYGNTTAIEDVYDDESYPKPPELTQALTATGFLTDKESFAFVHSRFEGYPQMPYELDATADLVQDQGFDSVSEFKSVKRTATEKIADAIWIYELIKAYKHPDTTPGNCDECGEPAGYPHTKTDRKDESIILCMNCSDIDPDSPPHSNYPYTPISDNEE